MEWTQERGSFGLREPFLLNSGPKHIQNLKEPWEFFELYLTEENF